ncbi:GLUG motif-containing protein [Sedimentisphaera salicampi]|uniref:Internalin-A n=1 Tax=Sedimentisphaera salicampi TaxID=1941349 RepID=A0A1W6LN13_9BACT|nr:GLUG motif-containing protein [Sedimentisphaera salicampi]ARN57167.1 hypothetical protein STSP1_01563 [Sedimentisphaera salicampi]
MCTLRVSVIAAIAAAGIAFGFSGGGTTNNPYQISTPDHLEAVNNDLSAHYVLTNDIDLSARTYDRAVIAPDTDHSDAGFNGTPFSGTFDGAGYKLLNLTVDTSNVTEDYPCYLGLFGKIEGGEVLNLGIENAQISGSNNSEYLGGLCGGSDGTITNCYATGSVSGGNYSINLGGLCGGNRGTIENCYAAGSVSGGNSSYDLGGLCGYNDGGIITNCYAAGSVSGGNSSYDLSGLCGLNEGTITNCFWDKYISGMDTSAGGRPKTTAQMKSAATFAGWNDGSWTIDEGNDYPRLAWENDGGSIIATGYPARTYSGEGTQENPFEISDSQDLVCLSNRLPDWGKYFVLTNDIDMQGINYYPITTFSGSFDGSGFKVFNLEISSEEIGLHSQLGVFGNIDGGEVRNLGIENADITGGDDSEALGGLCGANLEGTIENCYATGSVSGGNYSNFLGGLCGVNVEGTIESCYAISSVSGKEDAGGLCGYNIGGTITNCYAAGSVSGDDYSRNLGGLCGVNGYGTIENSFWDKEASGISTSAGGRPKTTAQMKSSATFAGWNDGSWTIDEGNDYPRLAWENDGGSVITTDYPARTYSGEGTQENPFEISDSQDLVCLSNRLPDWDKYFVLTNDIDMQGIIYYPITIFSGSFDGSGFKVFNLEIRSEEIGLHSQLGVFGKIDDGEVHNLGIEDADITGSDDADYIGGLCGHNRGTITNCYAAGSVSGDDYLGGLCGRNSSGTITNCYATGSVSGGYTSGYLGGLCGENEGGTIGNCYATGSVSGDGYLGGLCGRNYEGTISNCFWDKEASGISTSDGGTGLTTAQMQTQSTFTGSGWDFAGEEANGSDEVWFMTAGEYPELRWQVQEQGGGTINNPYQISTPDHLEAVNNDLSAHYVLTNDIDLSGRSYDRSVIAPDTDYTDSAPDTDYTGSDFSGTAFSGSFDGAGYKILNLTVDTTNVTEEYPRYLGLFGKIDDGEVHNLGIENADITGGGDSRYLGGLCGGNLEGTIENCYATGSVSGYDYLGGLCGGSDGTITNCYAAGSVSGYDYLGGLCGGSRGTIENCYAAGSVSGGNYSINLGGLCGGSDGTITNCYATGDVSGYDYLGGLCGGNRGTIENCYAAGSVSGDDFLGGLCGANIEGTITNCFWDKEASGISTSDGGTGLTTAQMQTLSTFTDSGWDFAGEEANGSEDVWIMPESDYPKLTAFHRLTVIFNAGENGVISSGDEVQTVYEGEDAVEPTVTANAGWVFTGWDIDFTDVQSNLTVTAEYTKEIYTVTFAAGANGTITAGDEVQDIPYGGSATAPTVEADEGWEFASWDKAFDNVTSDITATATYSEIPQYTVTFDAGANGSITAGDEVQTVYEGEDAVEPTVTANAGWDFTGWDIDFTDVQSNLTVTAEYTKEIYTVTFAAGANGTITAGDEVQDIPYGGSATAPTVEANEGWEFASWDTAFDNVTSDITVTATYSEVPQYTVTFDAGANGSVTAGDAVQTVYEGEDAVEPTIEASEGWEFIGWDVDFTNVQSDLTVTAEYTEEIYTVTFAAGANGTITAGDEVQNIPYGGSATAPTVEANEGWEFASWDTAFDNVTSDITVTATYSEIPQYTVTFDAGANGSITAGEEVQTVYEGDDAVAPTVTANAGWEFTGWDIDFTDVQSNLTVTAQYEEIYTVTFAAGANGTITAGDEVQKIPYGGSATAPTVEANGGWEHTGWDTAFDNVTSDITATATYSEIPEYTVTFDAGTHGIITAGDAVQTVYEGEDAVEPTIEASEGWEIIGWDADFTNVQSDLTTAAQYEQITYTVTFMPGANGTITAGDTEQTIAYGGSATAPTVEADEGYIFTGWDTAFDNVTEGLTVNAVYNDLPDIYTVNFYAGEYGKILSGASQQVDEGEAAALPTLVPDFQYRFEGWYNGDTRYSLSELQNVTQNMELTAAYSLQPDPEPADADFNGDNYIGPEDLAILLESYLTAEGSLASDTAAEPFAGDQFGDIDSNQWVDNGDFYLFSSNWMKEVEDSFTYNLVQGYNWISFPVLPEDKSLANVMEGYEEIVENFDNITASNGKTAQYYNGQWYGTLQNIVPTRMYVLYSANGGTFEVSGSEVGHDGAMNLYQGWNWLPFFQKQSMSVQDAFQHLDVQDLDQIIAPNGEVAQYYGNQWYGTLDTLEPGVGYKFNVSKAQGFSYTHQVSPLETMSIETAAVNKPNWDAPQGLSNQMKTRSTFKNAGWDFADSSAANEEDGIWLMDEKSYPKLNVIVEIDHKN